MERRTLGIIATIVTIFLCACPGLALCLFGVFGISGTAPINYTLDGTPYTMMMPSWVGIVLLCISLILVLIPIVIGIITLRIKPTAPVPAPYSPPPPPPPAPDEPIPPAI
ncbi:MAG: hypothetical protein ACM3PY_13190 [Omnitrophica WOR_2 bacterium]